MLVTAPCPASARAGPLSEVSSVTLSKDDQQEARAHLGPFWTPERAVDLTKLLVRTQTHTYTERERERERMW